jgi:hypothetical protein
MIITNIRKNIMGTASFDGQAPGMRKPQDFIVYPMQDAGTVIDIQSSNYWGQIDLATGEVLVSTRATGHAGRDWLAYCQIAGITSTYHVALETLAALRACIKSTGGLEVGLSIVKSDNTGALAL